MHLEPSIEQSRLSARRVEEAHRQAILEHDIRQLSFIVEYKRNRGDSDHTSRNRLEMMRPNEHRRKRVVVRAAQTEEPSQYRKRRQAEQFQTEHFKTAPNAQSLVERGEEMNRILVWKKGVLTTWHEGLSAARRSLPVGRRADHPRQLPQLSAPQWLQLPHPPLVRAGRS